MKKMWGKYKSIALSYILVKAVLVLIIAAAFMIPYAVGIYFDDMGPATAETERIRLALTVALYLSLPPAGAAVFMLDKMLHNIKNDIVFDMKNVRFLRYISWCCYLTGAIYFALGFYILLAFSIAVAASFFGLIVRVIKNLFCEAVDIKTENDMTI